MYWVGQISFFFFIQTEVKLGSENARTKKLNVFPKQWLWINKHKQTFCHTKPFQVPGLPHYYSDVVSPLLVNQHEFMFFKIQTYRSDCWRVSVSLSVVNLRFTYKPLQAQICICPQTGSVAFLLAVLQTVAVNVCITKASCTQHAGRTTPVSQQIPANTSISSVSSTHTFTPLSARWPDTESRPTFCPLCLSCDMTVSAVRWS